MKDVILQHLNMYPQMEIQDIIKLIYQSEFGGGHMISNSSESLDRLYKECMRLSPVPPGTPIRYESIGHQLGRLYLNGIENHLSLSTVNRFFVNTANQVHSDKSVFIQRLDKLVALCEQGELPFDACMVRAYVEDYKKAGCPMTHHSPAYRKAYAPAYRVISADFMRYIEVFERVDRLLRNADGRPVLVAIDGRCGSGKSFLCRLLGEVYDCNQIHVDDFFLRPEQRTQERLTEVGGNVDYERFQKEVLKPLLTRRQVFDYQRYDCMQQRLTKLVTVREKPLTIIEGSYSLHPYFGDIYDLKLFMDLDKETQKQRLLERNGEYMLGRFLSEWIPKEEAYFKTHNIREKSDLVLSSELQNS